MHWRFATYLLWRFESSYYPSVTWPRRHCLFRPSLILETVNGIDHGVYLLIKSRKADRSSQANRIEAEFRSAEPTILPWLTS